MVGVVMGLLSPPHETVCSAVREEHGCSVHCPVSVATTGFAGSIND